MAGEIYIADKATLDSVKQDTNFIKGQLLISSGTDLFSGTFKTNMVESSHYDYVKLDIKGKGIITFINPLYLTASSLRIQVDGGAIMNFFAKDLQGDNVFIPFKTSIKITSKGSQDIIFNYILM